MSKLTKTRYNGIDEPKAQDMNAVKFKTEGLVMEIIINGWALELGTHSFVTICK